MSKRGILHMLVVPIAKLVATIVTLILEET